MTALPVFVYHPDPAGTGSIEESGVSCICCGQPRGWIYTGPVYCEEDLSQKICPWCIGDGSAHRKFSAEFTDRLGIGAYGHWDAVPAEALDEVAFRTPGFGGWQQERWWTHCGDAAEFLGHAGHKEAVRAGAHFIACLRDDVGEMPEADWEDYFRALDADGSPTAYLFRCRHCGELGGYSDCD